MSPFVYSFKPLSHEEYGWQKKKSACSFLAIVLCSANSVPLSAVMVCTHFLYGNSIRMTAFANPVAFFPSGSFSINRNPVFRSASVTMAPFPSFPMMVSISQSPTRERSSTTGGRFSIDTLSLMVETPPTGLFLCLSLWRRCV